MVKLEDDHLTQVLNIMATSIEATEHFSMLIKEKKLEQSISIFSTIVEGFEAIQAVLTSSQDLSGKKERDRIEQLLLMIAQEMEQGRLLKVSEILQFSLKPQLRKLKQSCEENINSGIS